MYAAIFRLLPGPKWLKVIWSILLIVLVAWLLLEFAFPWVQDTFNVVDNTVDVPGVSTTST
ncbi:hypothetical protein [Gleimia europaea]|uniref:Uncharacterized protein n=1 Tax=Gleimia europaea ACS-120-V-Col10b TaxID=883069 RepID=A0A9W5RF99_9ACTO|nr:hypothetical protein [Gleimia europaea]EPD31359.1 hypothetical protein HMPREF9238_01129 [Gleimia europaea ACS-120-V-Col10b]